MLIDLLDAGLPQTYNLKKINTLSVKCNKEKHHKTFVWILAGTECDEMLRNLT